MGRELYIDSIVFVFREFVGIDIFVEGFEKIFLYGKVRIGGWKERMEPSLIRF